MFTKILLGFLVLSVFTACSYKQDINRPSSLAPVPQTVTNTDTTTGNPVVLPPEKDVKPVNID